MSTFLLCSLLLAQPEETPAVLEASKSVVALRFASGHGSGFVIDAKGWILTNAHVACSPQPYVVEVRVESGGRAKTLTFKKPLLAGVHPERDLALVRIDPAEHGVTLPALRLAPRAPVPGQPVHAIGFPGDIGGGRVKVRSGGKVLAADRQVFRRPYVEAEVSIAPGNSGGPLCAENGEVVGVVTLHDPETGSCYAVPAWEVQPSQFVPLRQRGPDPGASVELLNEADKCLRISNERRDPVFLEYAAQFYERAGFWDPGNDEILLKVAGFHLMRGDAAAAAAHLTRSLTLNPWPSKGALVYAALANALDRLRRGAEVEAVTREGLLKYPDRCGLLLEILASEHAAGRRWVEAALFSRRALRQGASKPELMNQIHREARAGFTPEQEGDFRQRDVEAPRIEAEEAAAAAAARRAGKAALTPAFQAFLDGFDGVQREGGGRLAAAGGSLAAGAEAMADDEVARLFAQAQFRVGQEHLRAARFDQAEESFQDVVKNAPRSPEAADARRYLMLLAERKKK